MSSAPAAFPVPEAWIDFHVSYGETDAMGVVYYANYLHWFEKGRSALIRERGVSYREVEERGILLPVREARCRYVSPARFDDRVRVRTGIGSWGRASMTFVYEVYKAAGDGQVLLATGETQHACVGPSGRPTAIPAWLRELFAE